MIDITIKICGTFFLVTFISLDRTVKSTSRSWKKKLRKYSFYMWSDVRVLPEESELAFHYHSKNYLKWYIYIKFRLPRNVENKRYFKAGKKLHKLSFLSSFRHWICVTNNLTLYYISAHKNKKWENVFFAICTKKRINRYSH